MTGSAITRRPTLVSLRAGESPFRASPSFNTDLGPDRRDKLDPEDLLAAGFTEIPEGDGRLQPPDETTAAPVDPQLPLLPTDRMHWTQFERLLLRVAREVRGLRSVSLLGDPGQKQEGLDVIGLDGAGQAEGIQSKKYVKFTKADLDAAVEKFNEGTTPFPVPRLVIGVACSGHEAKVAQRLVEINKNRDGFEVEILDNERLSELLRNRPEIVREFFGAATAVSFCVPHDVEPVLVPAPDAVSLAGAVLAGPASMTGVQEKLAAADAAEPEEPDKALGLVLAVQAALDEAGFPAHAQVLDERVVALRVRLGRGADAARLLLDRLWSGLAADQPDAAAVTLSALERLGGPPDEGKTEHTDGPAPDPYVSAAVSIARRALAVYMDPFGRMHGDAIDDFGPGMEIAAARLLLLEGESALADADVTALSPQAFLSAADQVPDRELAVRLRLVAADIDGHWQALLQQARTRAHGRDLSALVLARHARYRALEGDFGDAEANWAEAVEQACLVRRHEDAAAWMYSRRTLASRYQVLVEDTYHLIASALNSRPDKPRLVAAGRRTRERALDALNRDKPRAAVARLRRYLIDSVVSGSWQEEHDARELLADCYAANGEHAFAAQHLALAGQRKQLVELAKAAGDDLLPVQPYRASPLYWVQASAFSALAAQSDLVADEDVSGLVELGLDVLATGAAGTLVDTPLFGPSKFLAAHEMLASLLSRATKKQANRYLALVVDRAPRDPNRYFHTDEDHAKALAAIAWTQPDLIDKCVSQLLDMLSGQAHYAERYGTELLIDNLDRFDVRQRMAALAAEGNHAAVEMLATATKPDVATADDLSPPKQRPPVSCRRPTAARASTRAERALSGNPSSPASCRPNAASTSSGISSIALGSRTKTRATGPNTCSPHPTSPRTCQ